MVFPRRNSDGPAPDDNHQPQSFEGLLSDEDRQKLQEMVDDAPEATADMAPHPPQPDSISGETLSAPNADEQPPTPLITPIDANTPMYPGAMVPSLAESGTDTPATDDGPPEDMVLATLESSQQETESLSREIHDLIAERDELTCRLLELETIAEEAQQLIWHAQSETEQRTQEFQEQRDEFEGNLAALTEERQQFADRTGTAEGERDDLQGQRLELETQLQTLQGELSGRQDRMTELESQLQTLQAELSGRRERMTELGSLFNDATERLDASATQIDEIRREADGLKSTLDDREETIAQSNRAQEAGRAEAEDLHHQLKNTTEIQQDLEHRVEALTSQLDVARSAAEELENQSKQFCETLRQRESELAGLQTQRDVDQEAADAARNRHEKEMAEHSEHAASLQSKLDESATTLRQNEAEQAELRTQLDADQEAADTARNRHEQEMAEHSEHAASLQSKLDESAITLRQRDEAIEQLERRRDELQHDYESERTRAGEQVQKLSGDLDSATAKSAEYKTELEQLWSLRDTLSGIERERDDAQASARDAIESVEAQRQTLEATRDHLQGIALHLERRKRRLSGLNSMLHQRSDAMVKERLQDGHERLVDEQRKVNNERQRVSTLRQTLVTSEQKMLRLWAPQKASLVMSTLVIAIAMLGAGSWFLTGWLFPPVVAASFTIMPETKSHAPLSPEQQKKWRTMHTKMPGDTSFRASLLRRVQDRQIPIEELDLDAHLEERLTIDATQADRITYTLSGTNRHETIELLDVLASSLITESTRNLERHADRAYAVATNEQREGGVSRYASFNPLPVEDRRLLWLGPVFASLAGLAGVVFGLGLRQFRGIKRVINSNTVLANTNQQDDP